MAQLVGKLLLERCISIWRIPSELHSDRGTHFSGQIIEGICKIWMIMQHFHCACHLQSSGLIEKTNETIKTQLAKITDISSFPWLKALPLVLNLGYTPLTNIICLPLKLLQGDQWDWIIDYMILYYSRFCLGPPRVSDGYGNWKWKSLSHVRLFATPWTIQSMEFSRSDYWCGEPFSLPGDLSNSGIKPRSPALQVDSLPAEPQGKPSRYEVWF